MPLARSSTFYFACYAARAIHAGSQRYSDNCSKAALILYIWWTVCQGTVRARLQGENTVQYVDVMDRIGNRLGAAYTLDRWVEWHCSRKFKVCKQRVCSKRSNDYAACGFGVISIT